MNFYLFMLYICFMEKGILESLNFALVPWGVLAPHIFLNVHNSIMATWLFLSFAALY